MLRFLIALGSGSMLCGILWFLVPSTTILSNALPQASTEQETALFSHNPAEHGHHGHTHSHQHPNNKGFDCGTDELMQRLYKKQPALLQRALQSEQLWQRQVQVGQQFNFTGGVHTIPVVVHLVHNNGPANLTNPQVQSAIQYLNDAFANVGYYNPATGADTEIQFCLAQRDPTGNGSTGITRTVSTLATMDKNTQDVALKNLIRWDANDYINIWVVDEILGGTAGYAYLPSAHGNSVDGIVIEDRYMGFTPSETAVLIHEVGHYFGLYHTFESGCTNNSCIADGDKVCDTPPDNTTVRPPCGVATNSCSSDEDDTSINNPFRSTTLGGQGDQPDQKENYMDYSDLACYDRFSQGQADRMQFFLHGTRASLLLSQGCQPACTSAPITATFTPSALTTTAGTPITFTNTSANASSYEWYVDGVSFSVLTNSSYNFPSVGTFWIKLDARNGDPNCAQSDSIQITVFCAPPCGEICDNGIDDDGNGAIDCFDTACACETCSNDEGSYWYFGDNAGLNFNSGSPVSITNGRVRTSEASTTISDVNGNLLFYTDGITVWNRNHLPMPNGTGLLGHTSTAQMVVVPKPNDPSIYYIFIPPMQNFTNGLTYTTVDLSLNNNLGGVTAKNIPVTNFKTTEGITAIKHCNNKDYWVIAKQWQSNRYIVVPITAAGVSTTFLSQNIGRPHNNIGPNQNSNAITVFRGSPDGNRLAALFRVDRGYEIYDFDKSTGVLSNNTYWPTTTNTVAFGLEFSASGRFLYASTLGQWNIYQYDLTTPTAAAISASSYLVTSDTRGGGIQMGPDQKIYRARNGGTTLDVINNPDLQGVACNYQGGAVNLSPRTSRLGLPNFIKEYVTQPIQSFLMGPQYICNVSSATIERYTISDYQCNIDTVIWRHSGVNTVTSIMDSVLLLNAAITGADTLMATIVSPCTTKTDTLIIQTIIAPTVDLGPDTSVCQNGLVSFNVGGGYQSCIWQDNSQDSIFTATESGTYWVTCMTFCGTMYSDTVNVTIDTLPVVSYPDTLINLGDTLFLPTGSITGYQHQWSPNQNISCDTCPLPYFNPSITTTYYHVLTNGLGCVSLDSFTITVVNNCSPLVVLDSSANACGLTGGYLRVQGANGLAPYSYLWSTGDTTTFVQNLLVGDYYVTLTDGSNCVVVDTFSVVAGLVPAVVTAAVVDPTCGATNGSIALTTTNVARYNWSTGDTTATLLNLIAGTYNVTLTSTQGCMAMFSYNVNNSNAPSIQLDSLTAACGGLNGALQIQGINGSAPYQYLWSTGDTSNNLQNLSAGVYYLTLTDASNCPVMDSFNIDTGNVPQVVVARVNDPTCGLNNGEIALNTLYTQAYWWSTGDTSAALLNLLAGTYSVTLTSIDGCTDTTSYTLTNSPPPVLQVDSIIAASCEQANGSITLQLPSALATYQYQWSTGDTTTQLSNLVAGTYKVTVSDNNNCQDSLTIIVPALPTPSLAAYINAINLDSAWLNTGQPFTLGAGADERAQGVQYSWLIEVLQGGSLSLDSTDVPNTTGIATDTGLFLLKITATNTAGCSVSDTVWVSVEDVNFLGVPNAFTPNGDGTNDQFAPIGLSKDQVTDFRIYNRWGNVVHDINNGQLAWDGRYQGTEQPTAIYIYYLSYQLPGEEVITLKGEVTLIR